MEIKKLVETLNAHLLITRNLRASPKLHVGTSADVPSRKAQALVLMIAAEIELRSPEEAGWAVEADPLNQVIYVHLANEFERDAAVEIMRGLEVTR